MEVPLPDEAARRRLFSLYAGDLPFSDDAIAAAAARAEGVTASFARELVRRAVLLAADRAQEVADEHLAATLDELLDDREALTRSLLGSPSRRDPYAAQVGEDEEGEGEDGESVAFLSYRGSYRPLRDG